MKICKDCGSDRIIDVDVYEAWFRTGTMIKRLKITVEKDDTGYWAKIPELNKYIIQWGRTQKEAINHITDWFDHFKNITCLADTNIVDDEND